MTRPPAATGALVPSPRPAGLRRRRSPLATLLSVAALVALGVRVPAPVEAQELPAAQGNFGEALDVTLVTTSFYVVDAQGKPVRDLRPDEVEVHVGDQMLELAHFEAVGGPPSTSATSEGDADTPAAPEAARPVTTNAGAAAPRHVFLFFDLAFSLPRGVAAARRVAGELVGSMPSTDLLYLVTYSTDDGLEQEMGPVRTAAQREVLQQHIAAIEPDDKRLMRRPDLQPIVQGKRNGGGVEEGYLEAQQTADVNYELQGADLAKQLEAFSVFLRQIPGAKVLMYFSQGIDSDIYGGAAAGVSASQVGRLPGLHNRFAPALKSLSQTGAMVLFVNPIVGFEPGDRVEGLAVDADASWVNNTPTGDGALQLMSEVSGGMVLRDPNPKTLQARIDGLLEGRYELGVYLAAQPDATAFAADIRVTRPGARAWTAKWLQPPRTVRQLAPPERAFLAVQLVMQSDPRLPLRNLAGTSLEPLRGVLASAPENEQLRLRFEPDEWAPELLLHHLELYSVVLAPGDPPKLTSLEQRRLIPTPAREAVESLVPNSGQLLWGLVAFDLMTGKIYLGRFPLSGDAVPGPTPVAR
jgi:hypothetical protein